MVGRGYEVKLIAIHNKEIIQVFHSIQAAYRFVRSERPDYSRKKAFDVVNHSIDDKIPWNHNNEAYLFATSEEIRLKRADRKTRS